MAVKHKVVERVYTPSRLHLILRALQNLNLEIEQQGMELPKVCETIVQSLGTVSMPQKTEEYVKFMADVKNIQEILTKACTSEELISTTLKTLYNCISDRKRQRHATMSIVLQLISIDAIPDAVKWLLSSGYSEQSLEEALMTLCCWLSCWTWTPNLGPLVLCFMEGLEEEGHYDILVQVTLHFIERLFKLLILSEPRKTVGPVVLHMLSSMQHNPEAFNKIAPHFNKVLTFLQKENSENSQMYLLKIVNLSVALMETFPQSMENYVSIKRFLETYTTNSNYKSLLNCKPWINRGISTMIKPNSFGKVGLNNLGNTCYMNSVLQALFMTKIFRNDVLLAKGDLMPLFSKLQILFALLQHSQKSSLSPNDILNLARPPGFQPGHQHDSSEFLGYLLDVLHEQEKSISGEQEIASNSNAPSSSGSATSAPLTVVQRSFGGRSVTISRCNNCGNQSERADTFRELQLSFPSSSGDEPSSIQHLVDYYLQPERLCDDNQYHCDKCGGLTDGERVTKVVEPPPRLVLTLKNFRYDSVSQQRTKLLQRVKLDGSIKLEGAQYNLYATVVHCGMSLDSGHYYTFAKDGATATQQEWYMFSDCVVTRASESMLGNMKHHETPYILFYSREDCVDPAPLPRSALSPRLENVVLKDLSENENERRRAAIRTVARNNRNDDPPPPGCSGGGLFNPSHTRFVC
ncbi:ubiquitin carboxyl-terminal hydrolase 35 [Agrilus planipennis]|uniref:Ubiquitin carboxyl-terminal hydrolase n=1 Tax=Agrilus planipennis TaxID=224129 RepID=A0A7F5R979_AGRPL|nr:ubiquitin carboxyl-terminal hydrolase 35 [Agrilus planipennis]